MKIHNRINLTLAGFLVLACVLIFATRAGATGNNDDDSDCNGIGNCNDIEIETNEGGAGGSGGDGYGGTGGAGGTGEGGSATSDANSQADAAAEADANSEASAAAAGGSVGDINISGDTIPADTTHRAKITLENTPDIVTITPGSGDKCKAHIGFGASIPGLGTSLNIPLPGKECRKLNYYDRMVASGDMQAAEIIFCSLKEVAQEFKDLGLDCRDTLSLYVVPPAEPLGVTVSFAEYDDLMAQAQAAEAVEKYAERSENRYVQQQSLIEHLQEEAADDDAEIKALKKKVTDEVAEADARRAKVRAKLAEKREEKSDGPESLNQ